MKCYHTCKQRSKRKTLVQHDPTSKQSKRNKQQLGNWSQQAKHRAAVLPTEQTMEPWCHDGIQTTKIEWTEIRSQRNKDRGPEFKNLMKNIACKRISLQSTVTRTSDCYTILSIACSTTIICNRNSDPDTDLQLWVALSAKSAMVFDAIKHSSNTTRTHLEH